MVYIDGFNLYFGLRESDWHKYYWLNPLELGKKMLRQGQTLVGVRHFTSRVNRPPDKVQRQAVYLDALETLRSPEFDLQFGRYRSKMEYCVRCCRPRPIDNEKMTDVNIALSMVLDAMDNKFDIAFLISGDGDLENVVVEVQRRFPPKQVWMAFPPARFQQRLADAAAGRIRIKEWMLKESQFPETVTSRTGFPLKRPSQWS